MQPNNPYGAPAAPPPDYGFITSPPTEPKRAPNLLPSNGSPVVRIAVIVGGLIVLLILFLIIKGLLSGGGNTPALIAVGQQQQEIIHLASNATSNSQTTALSGTNENFAVTALASVTSAQTDLLTYLSTNGHKVKDKTLGLKVDPILDQQLTTAATDSNYDATFKQIMQTQLSAYEQAIRTAYQQTTGPKGRKMLTSQFNGAKLLEQQLNSSAS